MSFILRSKQGRELQINAWNWRPTLDLLASERLLDPDGHARLGANGCGAGIVDGAMARRFADGIERWLTSTGMKPGQRLLGDLTLTSRARAPIVFSPGLEPGEVDSTELYSTTHEWLVAFADFCRHSNGFDVY